MNELYKETILSVIITELATFEDVTEKEFILKYENLFAKYTDITKLKEMLEKRMPSVNWKIIENAKQLALDYKDSSEEQENINPLCSIRRKKCIMLLQSYLWKIPFRFRAAG